MTGTLAPLPPRQAAEIESARTTSDRIAVILACVTTTQVRDKELQKLVDQAAKQRRQQEQARSPREKRDPPPPNPVRLGVYAEMWKGGPGIFWFLPLTLLPILVILGSQTWLVAGFAAYGVALALRILWYVIGLFRGFAAFKRFPADLRTTLVGWYPMLAEKLVNDPEQWQKSCELAVTLEDGADAAPVIAALDLFVPQANGWYYTPDTISGASGDPRTKWTREGTCVTGSLNVWILGELYRLINQLDWIHSKTGGIARISVKSEGGFYGLSRPSYSSSG